jgi:hypothetical protein
MYAWRDEAQWHFETVDSGGSVDFSSLALDMQGRPHISYQEYSFHFAEHGILKHAWLGPSHRDLNE